jgi:hypothetical protein
MTQLSLFEAIQTSARAAGQTIKTAPTPRPVLVEDAPAPLPPMKRERPPLPPVPALVAECRTCHHAAYLVHRAGRLVYACSNPAGH